MSIAVASWNIHSGVGGDGRFRPERIAAVIGELDADVAALQEVGTRRIGFDMTAYLRDACRCEIVTQVTLHDRSGAFGNAILTRLPILRSAAHDISVDGREPRGALEIVVVTKAGPLRIIATHLGLLRGERRQQTRALLAIAGIDALTPTLLLGDFNVWQRHDDSLSPLRDHFGDGIAPRTFPALLPLLRLDRLFHDDNARIATASTHRSRAARIASDHLPLFAQVDVVGARHAIAATE